MCNSWQQICTSLSCVLVPRNIRNYIYCHTSLSFYSISRIHSNKKLVIKMLYMLGLLKKAWVHIISDLYSFYFDLLTLYIRIYTYLTAMLFK